MRRLLTSVALTTLLTLSFTAAQAQTVCNPSRAASCTDQCGTAGVDTCTGTGSNVSCICKETTKDAGNGNAFGTATQEEITGQGNLTDQPPPTDLTSDCTGNKGQCKKQ
jgi:hypothetical protein